NAKTFEEAKHVANTIATSALVKTALYGQDANWGRILCAVGYSGIENVDPTKVNLTFIPSDGTAPLELLKCGEPIEFSEERALEVLKHEDIYVKLDLGVGNESAKMYTCDFSHEYVSINADYRS
ncbi:glutamate N-acetyltransferase, partial [Basidiobolus ranarum]